MAHIELIQPIVKENLYQYIHGQSSISISAAALGYIGSEVSAAVGLGVDDTVIHSFSGFTHN